MGTLKFNSVFCESEKNTSCANEAPRDNRHAAVKNTCAASEKDGGYINESVDLRTQNSYTYMRNNNLLRKVISAAPLHFCGDDGKLKPIDTRLYDNGKIIENAENGYKVKFDKDANNGKIFSLTKGEKVITLSAGGLRARCSCGCACRLCDGNSTVLATLDDGTEIEYLPLADRVKENIKITQRKDLYEYFFTLDIGGLKAEKGENNTLRLCDENGKTQFIIPAPFMYDANNKFSDKVSYEINANGGMLNIKVVADAEFINAETTALPVTIDPQIIVNASTAFKFETCYYNPSDPELSYFENQLFLYSSTNNQTQETAEITIYKDKVKVDGAINSVKLKITAMEGGSGYFFINGKESTVYTYQSGAFIFDITEDYVNTNGNVLIIFEGRTYYPEVQNSNVEFYANGQNAPQLIIDYVPNKPETGGEEEESEADKVPADKANIKRFKLGKNVAASVDVNTGAVTCEINSFDGDGFVFPLNIVNSYRKGNGRNYVGENWKLNLWSKLKLAQEDMANKTIYTYTDELGDEHTFKEVYYYVENGERHFVYKNDVAIDVSGNLTYNGKQIIRHQVCDNFTLIPVIDDFKNYQLIEQRSQERIQLEETVKAYKASLSEYVKLILPDLVISWRASVLDKNDCEKLFEGVSENSNYILLPAGSAYQLQSLSVSIKQLEKEISEQETQSGITADTELLRSQKNALKGQSDSIISQARKNFEAVKQSFINYFAKKAELELLLKHTPVSYLKDRDGTVSGFNKDGNLVCMFDAHGNTISLEYDSANKIISVYDNESKTLRFGYENGLLTSITDSLGRKTEYAYSGLNLQSVKFADGGFLNLKYQSNQIRSIETEDGLQYKFSFDADSRITEINTNSKPITISRNVITEKDSFNKTLAKTTFIYGENTAEISEKNGHSESYVFDSGKKVKKFTQRDGAGAEAVTNYVYDYTDGKTVTAVTVTKPDNKTVTTVEKYDNFNLLTSSVSDWQNISDTARVKTEINYSYDNDENLISAITCEYTEVNGEITQKNYVTNYRYNSHGSLTLTESYVEGEELVTGKNIEERFYDKNGNAVKTVSYNTLDSSTKFYSESVTAENGQIIADVDETGARVAEYGYKNGTNVINSVTYPDGGKIAYGRDAYNDMITSVTASDANGEANTTDVFYNCGLPVEIKSGSTVISNTYDHTRRKIFASVNNSGYAEYSYKDYTYAAATGKYVFGEKQTSIIDGEIICTVTQSDTGVDTADGVIRTQTVSVDGTKLSGKKYNAKQQLESAESNCIGSADKYNASFVYDGYGNLTSATTLKNSSAQVTESYTYDELNALKRKAISGAVSQTYAYYYDNTAAQKLSEIKFKEYSFKPLTDVNGRNTGKEILNGSNKISCEYISYRKVGDHATNMPATVWYGNGANIKDSIKYKYDNRGNICEIIENGHVFAKYSYDTLGRIVREDNKPLNKTVLYAYDTNGNITERCEYEYSSKSREELSEKICNHFTYDYDGDRLTNYNGELFTYNNFGSPTVYRGKALQWSYGKVLTNYDGVSFVYDGTGRRVNKNTISYVYDSAGNLIAQSNGLQFIYDNSGVAGVIYADKQYFYRKDAQGNIIAILDSDGNLVVKYVYDAWGNHAVIDANGQDIVNMQHIGNLNPFRYRSYYYDTETGLYYLQTRYYDPELGRFISQDSIEYADYESVNGLNLYAYCGNNPVMYVDPSGMKAKWYEIWKKDWWVQAGKVVGGIVLAAVGVAITSSTLLPAMASPLFAVAAEFGLTLSLYGAALVGSVFNSAIESDMSAIGWNPYNTNADNAAKAQVMSFYKGVPVIRISGMGGSMSLGVIFFDKSQDVEVLKHERGHTNQLMTLGIMNYLLRIGVPSVVKNGDNTPWELSASIWGGSTLLANGASKVQRRNAFLYLALAAIPIVNIGNYFWAGLY